ncbi:MAG: NfeD family protein [Deltaproteobacteria bacterium]
MKNILIFVLVAFLVFELIEHAVLPLFWLIKNRKRRSQYGVAGMIGETVEIRKWDKTSGQVLINGELWRAECEVPLSVGNNAAIESIEGLTLKLKPYEQSHKVRTGSIDSKTQNGCGLIALDKKDDA